MKEWSAFAVRRYRCGACGHVKRVWTLSAKEPKRHAFLECPKCGERTAHQLVVA